MAKTRGVAVVMGDMLAGCPTVGSRKTPSSSAPQTQMPTSAATVTSRRERGRGEVGKFADMVMSELYGGVGANGKRL